MLSDRLGIQSWCFRNFKGKELIEALLKCAVNRIELCGVHVNLDSPAEMVREFRDAGIVITSFGVNGFDTDEKAARKVFEFATLADFHVINASFIPEAIPMLERLTSEYGKKIMVHNHGRQDPLGTVRALSDVFDKTSDNIGFCLDTGWMMDAGENPLEIAKKFRDRLYGLHIKDFVFDRAGKPEDVIPGEGNLDLKGLLDYLKATVYNGTFTLEYEAHPDNPVPYLSKAVDAIRSANKSS